MFAWQACRCGRRGACAILSLPSRSHMWALHHIRVITWHPSASCDITQHKKSHHIKWRHIRSHHRTWHNISQLTTFTHQPENVGSHPATNHIKTGQHTTTMERFGHRSRWSPCAHSIGKFFLWLIFFFLETSAPGLPGSTCIPSFSYIKYPSVPDTTIPHQIWLQF